MNREIMKIVNRVVSEEFSGRISNIKNRLFENKGSEICVSCGSGDMYEGECMECGNMYEGNTQELGDNNEEEGFPEWEKLKKQMDDRNSYKDMGGANNDENNYRDLSAHNPYYGDDDEEGFPEWEKLKKQMDNRGELEEDVCEECGDTYESELDDRFKDNRKKIDKAEPYGKITPADFEALRSMKKEMEEMVYELDLEEDDVEEGNAFTGALSNAKKHHKDEFEVNGKKYDVKESKVYFTESEIIDIIENIVKEEKKKGKAPSAQNILKSTLGQSKKENEENIKRVAKKMKEYLKDGSKGKYEMDPTNFPEGNYDLDKRKESLKKYTPSEAVDEYIDAFSYPGMTNLVYDEIKPDDKKIEKYLKGHRTTGNAEFDEEGKPLGNVVPSKVGEKFKKNYDENLYGQEQMNASYKRYPQDTIEVAGDVTKKGSMKGKKTAQSVLNAVEESTEDKKVISEMEKIKNLIGYNQKTQ